jgi:hypothetical protein
MIRQATRGRVIIAIAPELGLSRRYDSRPAAQFDLKDRKDRPADEARLFAHDDRFLLYRGRDDPAEQIDVTFAVSWKRPASSPALPSIFSKPVVQNELVLNWVELGNPVESHHVRFAIWLLCQELIQLFL